MNKKDTVLMKSAKIAGVVLVGAGILAALAGYGFDGAVVLFVLGFCSFVLGELMRIDAAFRDVMQKHEEKK